MHPVLRYRAAIGVDVGTLNSHPRNILSTPSNLVISACVNRSHVSELVNSTNLVPKTHLHPTQVGLGIFQAIHCEVIYVSTVYCAVRILQPV